MIFLLLLILPSIGQQHVVITAHVQQSYSYINIIFTVSGKTTIKVHDSVADLQWFGLHHVQQLAASFVCQLVLAGSVRSTLLLVEMVNETRKNEPKHISCSQKGNAFHFYFTLDIVIQFIIIEAFTLLCLLNCHQCFITNNVSLYATMYVVVKHPCSLPI